MAMKQLLAASAVGASLALAGCVSTADEPARPDECGASALQNRIGEAVSGTTANDLTVGRERITTARVVRVAREGQPMTQDFRPDRLTIIVDEDGSLISASCV